MLLNRVILITPFRHGIMNWFVINRRTLLVIRYRQVNLLRDVLLLFAWGILLIISPFVRHVKKLNPMKHRSCFTIVMKSLLRTLIVLVNRPCIATSLSQRIKLPLPVLIIPLARKMQLLMNFLLRDILYRNSLRWARPKQKLRYNVAARPPPT